MKKLIKKMIKKCYPLLNHCPFNNQWKGVKSRDIKCRALFLKSEIDCKGKGNRIIINSQNQFRNCKIFIRGNNNTIEIAEDVIMKDVCLWIEDNNKNIRIGKGSVFSGEIQLACIEGQEILIGENCLFSSKITIRTGDSHSIINSDGKRINDSRSVVIGDHVWVGHYAMINKGVSLPTNSIVGAGAIVTKSFQQENIVIAGNPAKIIKEEINWLAERI
jgi:acetyltransferase-like isoleucine patch superfamily enzyme